MEDHTSYTAAKELLEKSKRILISGHLSPDGDSLGSMIALARMLTAAGHDAFATADVHALGKPGFLEGVADIIPLRRLKKRKFDLFIYVDCAAPNRLPPEVRPFAEKLPTLTIDHHATSVSAGAASIIDPEASSAGEIVWRFAKWMEWPLDRATAEALWVAIITDSGRFAYDSTRTGTLRAAADLLKYGVRTAQINDPQVRCAHGADQRHPLLLFQAQGNGTQASLLAIPPHLEEPQGGGGHAYARRFPGSARLEGGRRGRD